MALTQLRARIRNGASRQPTDADLRQAREAMQIALGKAQQPALATKTRARWQDTKRRYEAAADRLDRTGNREDRQLAGEVRKFVQERAGIETVPDMMLRDAEKRVRDAQDRARTDPQPDGGVPRGTPSRRSGVASWDRKGVALDRLSPARVTLYIDGMAKAQPTSTSTTVRDSKTGRFLTVRGVGALKGQLTLKKGVDLTKADRVTGDEGQETPQGRCA